MRKAALVAVSLMGLVIASTASLEAQDVVASVELTNLVKSQGEPVSLMTIYAEEVNAAVRYLGYSSSTTGNYVFDRSLPGLVALHRYRNRDNGDYFYTTDEAEGSRAVSKFNYIPEGICCYIAATQLPGTTPLFRLVSHEMHLHYYTPVVNMRDYYQYEKGYELEGIAGYLWSAPATLPAQ